MRPPRACTLTQNLNQRARAASAAVGGGLAEIGFDAQQLVVLGDTVGPGGGAGLDLAAVRRHGEIGDRGVLGLATTVAHHRRIAVAGGELDRVEGLGERADLVDLDEHRVGDAAVDALPQAAHVGDEQVVADELDPVTDRAGELGPALPVVLSHAVLDRHDRVALDEALPVGDHLVGVEHLAFPGEVIRAISVQLTHRRIEGDGDLLTRGESRLGDRFDKGGDRLLVGRQVGGEAALVAHRRRQAAVVEQVLQGVVRLHAPPQCFGIARRSDRHDHELLQVDRVVGVDTAVDDVHHRHGKDMSVGAADVAVQRNAELLGRSLGDRQADPEDCVGAETSLVVGAVELAQQRVDHPLRHGIEAIEGLGDLAVDEADRRLHAFAAVAVAAITQLDGLVFAGRGAAGHGGPSGRSGVEEDLDLDGRVATRIEDLAADDFDDLTHDRAT